MWNIGALEVMVNAVLNALRSSIVISFFSNPVMIGMELVAISPTRYPRSGNRESSVLIVRFKEISI
jgi:hypothetical protein